MKREKQIWFSKDQHIQIKVAAAKRSLSMRDYIVNLVKQDGVE